MRDPLEFHTSMLALCEQKAERAHNRPEARARWEAQAWDESRRVEAIKRDQERSR